MVQQPCPIPGTQWKSMPMSGPSETESSLNLSLHGGPTANDIIPKLTHVKHFMLIDAHSVYDNLKLDEKSSYLIKFASQFGGYRYVRLPFRAAPAGDMF